MRAKKTSENDRTYMARAIELAAHGVGAVEPNPMVGCVLVAGGKIFGEGWHRAFGGPHAEIEAIGSVAGPIPPDTTLYVTLEPCCHTGKTPPCTDAILRAGIGRVVIACRDPFPKVAGGGIQKLREAGVLVEVGLLAEEARDLNAPYFKRVETGRPWVIAKWAMTLDGKIATRTGDSQWISGEASRAIVHQMRGRMDAILVGRGTAEADDPMLTARPPGPRVATRVVFDRKGTLSLDSKLVRTTDQAPVLVVVGPDAPEANRLALTAAHCEVFVCDSNEPSQQVAQLLDELGTRRQMTNILIEGGSGLLGSLFDADAIDEFHVFVAPKLLGDAQSISPISGTGHPLMANATELLDSPQVEVERCGPDVYIHGKKSASVKPSRERKRPV